MLAYFDAFKAGKDDLTSTFHAARAFIQAYKAGGAAVPANSPCLAAARVSAAQIAKAPSSPALAAMLAFMDQAVLSNLGHADPVCLAAAETYFDAYAAGAPEGKATEAASVAYLDAVAATPSFNPGSACGRAAQSYIATFGGAAVRG
jgi:hypothetical protein